MRSATRQATLAFAVAILSMAAGCAEPPAGADEEAGGAASSAPLASPSTTSAGAAAASPPDAGQAATTETPVHVDGSTAAGACAAGQCHYELADTAFGELPATGGMGLRLAGTLTWDAVSPTSETLTVYVPTFVDGEYHWEPGYPAATGTSPLAFDLQLAGLASERLGLIVGNGVAAGSPLGVFALQTPQEFVLDATYTSQAP